MSTAELMNGLSIIGLAFVLEGLLNVDNMAILAGMANDMPAEKRPPKPFSAYWWGEQRHAILKAGLIFAIFSRIALLFVASWLIKFLAFKIAGIAYLLILVLKHFSEFFWPLELVFSWAEKSIARLKFWKTAESVHSEKSFWGTMISIEITDIVFSFENVVALVALAPNNLEYVVIGTLLGIVTMRMAAVIFQWLLEKEPALKHGAYLLLAAIALELLLHDFFHVKVTHGMKFAISGAIMLSTWVTARIMAYMRPVTHTLEKEERVVAIRPRGRIVDGTFALNSRELRVQVGYPDLKHEKLETVLVLDGSLSVLHLHSKFLHKRSFFENHVIGVSRALLEKDENGEVPVFISCLGSQGDDFLDIGTVRRENLERFQFDPDRAKSHPGSGSKMLPTLIPAYEKALTTNPDFIRIVVLSDMRWDDIEEVKEWLYALVEKIRRNESVHVKIVLVGTGNVRSDVFRALDDLQTPEFDIVDSIVIRKPEDDRAVAAHIFKETHQRESDQIVGSYAVIRANNTVVQEYKNGVPLVIAAKVPEGVRRVQVTIDGDSHRVRLY